MSSKLKIEINLKDNTNIYNVYELAKLVGKEILKKGGKQWKEK